MKGDKKGMASVAGLLLYDIKMLPSRCSKHSRLQEHGWEELTSSRKSWVGQSRHRCHPLLVTLEELTQTTSEHCGWLGTFTA